VSAQGTSALMYAAMKGRPECAKLLLAKGANVKLKSGQGFTALHFAASGPIDRDDAAHADGYPAVASLLLAVKGVDVDAQDNDGWTSVYCAAAAGQTETLKLLLQHGADFSKPDAGTGAMPVGATPLHQACAGRHADCVKELTIAGADEYAQDKLGRTPRYAMPDTGISDESYQACMYWLEHAWENDGTAAGQLGRLLKNERTLDVQAALSFFDKSKGKAPLDINAQMVRLYSRTALNLVAQQKSNPKWTQLAGGLIGLGADVNLESADEAPLFSAAYNGNTEVVRLLLDAGAAPNWTRGGKYDQGYTPLMTALYHGYEDTALALLDKGAATDTRLPPVDGDAGFMPLHLAVKEAKSLAVIKAIIERGGPGADVYARAGPGGRSTPLELAELAAWRTGNAAVFDYLKSVAPPPPPAEPIAGCVIC
jgi:ankyrin repeat protein